MDAAGDQRTASQFWTRLLSRQPARRRVERYWLAYTPVWGLVAGTVMLTGVAEGWGDLELMVFGVAMLLGAVVPPIAWPHVDDRERPLQQRTGFKMSAAVTAVAVLMN